MFEIIPEKYIREDKINDTIEITKKFQESLYTLVVG